MSAASSGALLKWLQRPFDLPRMRLADQPPPNCLVEALAKAQEEQKDKQQPPGKSPPPGQPQDPPLIDMIAELKMIRALQMRVNRRTDRYSELIEGEQALDADLVEALQRLADRETRIYEVTRDLELGRNK